MYDYSTFPNPLNPAMREGMQRYLEEGIIPGSFLTGVLQNDLRKTFESADHINTHLVREYLMWLYNEAPARSWGSPENVTAWVANFKREPR